MRRFRDVGRESKNQHFLLKTGQLDTQSIHLDPVDPMRYHNWNQLVLQNPDHSIFHTANWARVLCQSYGYRPFYFVYFRDNRLIVLLPFMEVKSLITGRRAISLPFTDYSDAIIDKAVSFSALFSQIVAQGQKLNWRSIQLRCKGPGENVSPTVYYYRHTLYLEENEKSIFSKLRSNYRRKIRKATKNGIQVKVYHSFEAIQEYYRLHCLTRKRHGLPPQPFYFFRNIHLHIISKELGFVSLAIYKNKIIAGAIYFNFGDKIVYKYGASDPTHLNLSANYLVMWQTIQWSCRKGYKTFCFGKTDSDQIGLIQFKDGWGAEKKRLNYYKYNVKSGNFIETNQATKGTGYAIFRHLPMPFLKLTGCLLYKHFA